MRGQYKIKIDFIFVVERKLLRRKSKEILFSKIYYIMCSTQKKKESDEMCYLTYIKSLHMIRDCFIFAIQKQSYSDKQSFYLKRLISNMLKARREMSLQF